MNIEEIGNLFGPTKNKTSTITKKGTDSSNESSHGDHITKVCGNHIVPWIQIGTNRNLYLTDIWFDKKTMSEILIHLEKLNKKFENTFNLFFKKFVGVYS